VPTIGAAAGAGAVVGVAQHALCRQTSPAGHFPPNAFGLRHGIMAGNAWQWTADFGATVDG
jgi:formylglycine-generating enzyme required for sulfatase activity